MVVLSKNSYQGNHVRDRTFIIFRSKGIGGGGGEGGGWGGRGGGLNICHVFAGSFIFKQNIYCSFLQLEGVVKVTKFSIFCGGNLKNV